MFSKHSYWSTKQERPYMYQTIRERLEMLSEEDPNREAFIEYNIQNNRRSITRQELLLRSTNVAHNLVSLGFKKGSTVAVCMKNSLEMLLILMGVSIAGGVTLFYNYHMKDGSDLVEMINFLEGRMLIIDSTASDIRNMLENIWPEKEPTCKIAPTLKQIFVNSKFLTEGSVSNIRFSISSLFNDHVLDPAIKLPDILPEDILSYFCTSGSTGTPKAVTYSHFCMLNWEDTCRSSLGMHGGRRYFSDRPFGWVVGYPRSFLVTGCTRVFVESRMTMSGTRVSDICDLITKENCDIALLPAYLVADIEKNRRKLFKLSNVQVIQLCGERIMKSKVAVLFESVCKTIVVFYGTTECGAVCTYRGELIEDFEDGLVGKPTEGAEMKVVDEEGNVVPIGQQGEILVRCAWRAFGYKNNDSLFHKSLDVAGWFHTGDAGHMRPDNNFVVDGRLTQFISVGTTKIYPGEVEKSLAKHPDVLYAYAVGVPDERLKQVVCACVQPKPGTELTAKSVQKFYDDLFLNTSLRGNLYKPKYCVILKNVPLLSTGKIDRKKIAEFAVEHLRLS